MLKIKYGSGSERTINASSSSGNTITYTDTILSTDEGTITLVSYSGTLYDSLGNSSNISSSSLTGFSIIAENKIVATISFANATKEEMLGFSVTSNPLTNTGNGAVTYSSSNTSAARVNSSTGAITLVAAGKTTITASVSDSSTYRYPTNTASYELTVKAHVHKSSCYTTHYHTSYCTVYHTHSSACYTYHSHTSSCYHSHTSSCYHTHKESCKTYHRHTSSCYGCNGTMVTETSYVATTPYGEHPTTSQKCPNCGTWCNFSTYVNYKCYTCGKTDGNYPNYTCSNCGYIPGANARASFTHYEKIICGKTTSDYTYTCGKSTSTIDCGMTTSTLTCGKTTSTIDNYYGCGKTTSTVERYTCGYSNGQSIKTCGY